MEGYIKYGMFVYLNLNSTSRYLCHFVKHLVDNNKFNNSIDKVIELHRNNTNNKIVDVKFKFIEVDVGRY